MLIAIEMKAVIGVVMNEDHPAATVETKIYGYKMIIKRKKQQLRQIWLHSSNKDSSA